MNLKIFFAFIFLIIIVSAISYYIFIKNSKSSSPQQISDFSLDFFVGGSIFGSSFEVKISNKNITYIETNMNGGKKNEVQKINRPLLPSELNDIYKTISDNDLINLSSRDFSKELALPDQALYRISIIVNGKENKINCSISASKTDCQKQIDNLRLKLNKILGVVIH